MDSRCPICDSSDLDARPMPPGHPHHAKVMCRRCGRFVRWLPKPAGPIPDHCLDAARPRPGPVELVGTKAQVRWANSIWIRMLVEATRARKERLAMLLRAVSEATWFIANRDRTIETLRWPAPEQLDLAHQEAP